MVEVVAGWADGFTALILNLGMDPQISQMDTDRESLGAPIQWVIFQK